MEDRVIQVFENEFFRTRGYLDKKGTANFNVEDVARGLGFTQTKNGVEYVRWETFNRYVSEIKANSRSQLIGKIPVPLGKDDYIPENLVYRLAMKANNETAEKLQAWIADEVVPDIRKTGAYISPNAEVISDSAATETFSREDKQIACLLRCAELTNLDRLRNQFLREAAFISVGKKFY